MSKKFNKKSVIHCVISGNVLGSICLCPDLHCFLWLRKWTRLKLNISKLGAEIFPLSSLLDESLRFSNWKHSWKWREKSDLVITEWDQPRRIFQILKLKRKSSDWFSLLTYFMENFIKFSIHWIFAQKNGLFLCSKHCQKVLVKYSWIFPMVDIIFQQKADRQLQSYSQKVFHNFSPQTGFNKTRDC